jgi:4-hydroxy-tetrahydrodipicolinate synthase
MVAMWRAWEEGKVGECRKLFFKLLPMFKALFLETNPIPLKFAMGLSGRMTGEVRLPMCPPSEGVQKALKEIMGQWGLLP